MMPVKNKVLLTITVIAIIIMFWAVFSIDSHFTISTIAVFSCAAWLIPFMIINRNYSKFNR